MDLAGTFSLPQLQHENLENVASPLPPVASITVAVATKVEKKILFSEIVPTCTGKKAL